MPLGVVCLDFARKEVRLVDYVSLSGNVETDLGRIRAAIGDCTGLRPECAAPIRFAEEPRKKD